MLDCYNDEYYKGNMTDIQDQSNRGEENSECLGLVDI